MQNIFYLFLDIDGVLNSWGGDNDSNQYKEEDFNDLPVEIAGQKSIINHFNKDNVRVFNEMMRIIEDKGYEVKTVIVSSWRESIPQDELQLFFNVIGVDSKILSYIPSEKHLSKDKEFYNRAHFVKEFIDKNSVNDDEYIILDDDEFSYKEMGLTSRLIKTSIWSGLTLDSKLELQEKIKDS